MSSDFPFYQIVDKEQRKKLEEAFKLIDPLNENLGEQSKKMDEELRKEFIKNVINSYLKPFLEAKYQGKPVKDYQYFQETVPVFEAFFLDKLKSKKSLALEYLTEFHQKYTELGIKIANFDNLTTPEKRFEQTTIDSVLPRYMEVYALLQNEGMTPDAIKNKIKLSPKIRNSVAHGGYRVMEDKCIKFFDHRTGKLLYTMTPELYENSLKQIFLLFHSILAGFVKSFDDKEVQENLIGNPQTQK